MKNNISSREKITINQGGDACCVSFCHVDFSNPEKVRELLGSVKLFRVTRLELGFCRGLKYDFLRDVILACPKLYSISFRGTHGVTNAHIKLLLTHDTENRLGTLQLPNGRMLKAQDEKLHSRQWIQQEAHLISVVRGTQGSIFGSFAPTTQRVVRGLSRSLRDAFDDAGLYRYLGLTARNYSKHDGCVNELITTFQPDDSIVSVDFSNTNLNDASLIKLPGLFPNAVKFIFRGCSGLTDELSFRQFLQHCQEIRHLDISHLLVSSLLVGTIAGNCPKLQVFNMAGGRMLASGDRDSDDEHESPGQFDWVNIDSESNTLPVIYNNRQEDPASCYYGDETDYDEAFKKLFSRCQFLQEAHLCGGNVCMPHLGVYAQAPASLSSLELDITVPGAEQHTLTLISKFTRLNAVRIFCYHIERMGEVLSALSKHLDVTDISLCGHGSIDADSLIEVLSQFKRLERIHLYGFTLSGNVAGFIPNLLSLPGVATGSLKSLVLGSFSASKVDVRNLQHHASKLRNLRTLAIDIHGLSHEELSLILSDMPDLQVLGLRYDFVPDAGYFSVISECCPKLECLAISGDAEEDDMMQFIEDMPSLTELNLIGFCRMRSREIIDAYVSQHLETKSEASSHSF